MDKFLVPATKRNGANEQIVEGAKKSKSLTVGNVYVARYEPGKPKPPTPTPGCVNVFVHTSSSVLGGALSPYHMRDERGVILESAYQFAKCYRTIPAQRIPLGRFHPGTIIWEHPAETHYDETTKSVLPAYWEWRRKGERNEWAVRYPAGFANRHNCLFALWPARPDEPVDMVDPTTGVGYVKLDYVAGRKRIYVDIYARLAPAHPEFQKLQRMLAAGTDLQILDVDGPRREWFLDTPNGREMPSNGCGMRIDEAVIRRAIEDTAHPFGHGYCIAAMLLDGAAWLR
jgi:hypothetical protein